MMLDEETPNGLKSQLLTPDNKHHLDDSLQRDETETSLYIPDNMWSKVSWQLELARKIFSCSEYSLMVFDIIYFVMLLLQIVVNFDMLSHINEIGGVSFTIFFIFMVVLNITAPPIGMHLIKSILVHPTIPKVFQEAFKYDSKYHFRMHCLAHLNCVASLLAVLLSFFTNSLYKAIQIPFLILYVVPLSFTLSIIVSLLEGHRLLACSLNESLEKGHFLKGGGDKSRINSDEASARTPSQSLLLSGGSVQLPISDHNLHSDKVAPVSSLNEIDFYRLRKNYFELHLQFDLIRQNWGLYILFFVVALLLFTVGLIWYSYISEFDRVAFSLVLPYIIITVLGLCEIMFSLTWANETGAKVSRTLAKFIFKYGQSPPPQGQASIVSDVNNLLILSQIVLIQIPFFEGFTLRARLTVVLVGPLVGSIIPKLLS